jgi:hypothetical protein
MCIGWVGSKWTEGGQNVGRGWVEGGWVMGGYCGELATSLFIL